MVDFCLIIQGNKLNILYVPHMFSNVFCSTKNKSRVNIEKCNRKSRKLQKTGKIFWLIKLSVWRITTMRFLSLFGSFLQHPVVICNHIYSQFSLHNLQTYLRLSQNNKQLSYVINNKQLSYVSMLLLKFGKRF